MTLAPEIVAKSSTPFALQANTPYPLSDFYQVVSADDSTLGITVPIEGFAYYQITLGAEQGVTLSGSIGGNGVISVPDPGGPTQTLSSFVVGLDFLADATNLSDCEADITAALNSIYITVSDEWVGTSKWTSSTGLFFQAGLDVQYEPYGYTGGENSTNILGEDASFYGVPLPTGAVNITGNLNAGQTLTADTSSIQDADGLGTFHYQWQHSADGGQTWQDVGSDQSTYVLTDNDIYDLIQVIVSFTDGLGYSQSVTGSTSPQAVAPGPSLFTSGAEVVNFNNLSASQKTAIASGADTYDGLGGNDVVTLPSIANYNESVGSGTTLDWANSAEQPFSTDSQPGDIYTVRAGDGNYYIDAGAGTDTITISGNGSSQITAGTGSDSIVIKGNGNNVISGGAGSVALSITGRGHNTFYGNLAGSAALSGSASLELTGNLAGSATINGGAALHISGSGDNITVNSGFLDVETGGTAIGTTVNSGGFEEVLLGGTFDGATINGGTLHLWNGANVGTGAIQFTSGTKGALVIDGPSNSSSVISGFTSGDQIDFEDLNFSAGVATIFDGIDNVLQVIGSGTTYRIQFDPSQNFSGGFQVASDGADGTVVTLVPHVVTGYTTTASGGTAISPYQGVCYIDDIFPDQPNRTISRATGFIIGPHTILTNAHVIKDTSGIAGAIEIVPGSANGRSSPSYIATSVEINQAYSPGQLVPTQSNEQYDFAVINVSADLSAYGIFGLQSAYSSGTLNLTGYPAYPYGISSKGPSAKSQYNDIGSATADRNYGVLDYGPINPIVSYQGNSGGPLWIYGSSGATAVGIAATTYYGVKITSADLQLINNWTANSLISTSISSNSIIVSGGQAAFNISVQNAGSVTIASGGIVTGASIGSGGTEIISGGTDLAGIVNDAGLQALGSGSFVSGTVLNDPGVQSVGFGATAVGVIVRGGIEIIASGGTASNTTVSSGGTLEVLSGGMATAWHLLSGATLVVEAPISGFTVGKGVTLVVSGTTGSKTTVLAGRTLELLGGATLSSNTVNAGGVLEIGSGAALSSYSVSRGIRLAAMSDGVVSSASVAGSGTLLVLPGGTAASATVSGGGLEAVSAGGAGSATVLKGGTIELFGSNSARYDLSAGANVLVGSGYVFSGTVSSGIAKVLSGGTDMGTTVSRGGMLIAASGGTLVGPMISAGGTAIVSSGGAVELLGGDTTSGLALLSGGTMEVGSGATLGSFIVSKGVTIEVLSGGLATTTVSVGNGGTLELLGGSTASYTLLSGATLGIASGYGLSGQTVSRGVVLKVLAGGAASATTVSSGGTELVASGGSDLGVNIDAKGLVRVMSGGFESGASIASGGVLIVSSGGAATGVNVASGGTQTISAGGTSTDLAVLGTALDAGTVILSDLALIGSSAVLETLSGGTAILSGSVTNSGTLFASGAHSLIDIVSGATVAGGGNAKIANGVVDIKGGGDNQNVVFQSGGTGGLVLADTLGNTSAFAGQVSGFGQNVHQFIDLGAVASGGSGVVSASYSSSTASSGVLTVTSGGSANVVAVIDFSGHYVTSNFHITSGASGSAEIFDPPVAALPPTVVSADLALFVNYLAASFPTMAHHGGFITDLLQPASEPLQLTRPGQ